MFLKHLALFYTPPVPPQPGMLFFLKFVYCWVQFYQNNTHLLLEEKVKCYNMQSHAVHVCYFQTLLPEINYFQLFRSFFFLIFSSFLYFQGIPCFQGEHKQEKAGPSQTSC